MIKSLIIDNIALIDHVEIDFEEGLTVLSGETGSGKSIIIDSLSFVLGERADKTLIKYGKDHAEVTAIFEIDVHSNIATKLDEYGYAIDSEFIVSRKMSQGGKNEVRIQGKSTTLAILKDICAELVDIFGQGEHLALLNEKNQLSVLDAFCNFSNVDSDLKQMFSQLSAINRELRSFGGSDAERARLIDILKYQIDEISSANLNEQEEDELNIMHKRMVNVEKIASALGQAIECLNAELGAVSQTSRASDVLRSISNIDEQAAELSARLESASIEIADVNSCLENLISSTEFSPYEVDKMEERLEKIRQVKRKYGGSVTEALKFLSDAESRYENLVNSTERIEELNRQKYNVLTQMYDLSKRKSAERKLTARNLSSSIMKELTDLGMKGTQFVVKFNDEPSFEEYSHSPSNDGFDKVEFLMSANIGEPLKPLSKVISGGEMSRFMLAVKNITALAEKIPTMVFDEIDTGISGNMAQKVAEKLANVSSNKISGYQCVVITHLPQIVAMADCNLFIQKYESEGKTHTAVTTLLTNEDKAAEVSRLMGGVGEHALDVAKELVIWSNNYKRKRA